MIGLTIILTASTFIGCQTSKPAPTSVPATQTAAPEAKTLEIGALLGLTGFFAVAEIPDANEGQICADIINERGGIVVKGQKYLIKIIQEDNKSTNDGVTAGANRLIFDKKIKFMLGPRAFFAPPAAPIADQNKVIRMLPYLTSMPGEVDASTPYAFTAGNGSVLAAVGVIKFLKKQYPNVTKVAVVTPDDGGIPYIIPILEKLLTSYGISRVGALVSYNNETQDFSPVVAKLNAIKDADAIFQMNGIPPHVGALIKGLREVGNTKLYVSACPGAGLPDLISIASKEAVKDVFTLAYSPDDSKMPPLAKEIVNRTIAKYGKDYPIYLDYASVLWVLKEVIQQAQSLDTTDIKNKFESMDKVDTIFGPAMIGGDASFGIKHHVVGIPQSVQMLVNDVITTVDWVDLGIVP
jgi:branched-chain amino acid transport system substrate-binding protein